MKKVNIITKHSSYNFGAMLQAYALQKTVRELGVDAKIIDVRQKKPQTKWSYKSPSGILRNIAYKLHRKEMERGFARFEEFITGYEKTKFYKDKWELAKDIPASDVYITGSDQVWNPLNIDDAFFLRFLPKDKIRASYAASLGVSNLPDGTKNILSEYLTDFDYISVRESSGKEELEKITDKEISVNVDPTLLLDKKEWENLSIKPKIKKPYVLCYVLYRPKWLNGFLKKIRKQTKKDIVMITTDAFRRVYHNKAVRDAGPKEFLGLIQNADLIISTSFHGVALSVANKKPFYAVVNPSAPSRISDLLNLLGLKDRIVDENSKLDYSALNYDSVDEILKLERKKSIDYLNKVIDGVKTESKIKQFTLPKDISGVLQKCTACTACKNVCPTNAISMIKGENGFIYPQIDKEKCISCGLCAKTCHALSRKENTKDTACFYYGWSKDKDERRLSSSGGIFGAVANKVLNDGGLVIGACFDEKQKKIIHLSTDKVDIGRLRRSKYAESEMGDSIVEIKTALQNGRKVLFCGTPCQCAGVRKVFKENDKLILCDFLCHGVPSAEVFKKYLLDLEKRAGKQITDYSFRTKDFGWSGYGLSIEYSNKKTKKTVGRCDWFFRASMLDNLFLRPSCYTCDRNVYHESDLTLGDFWGVVNYNPKINDQKGISIIGVNTKLGESLIKDLESSCEVYPLDKKYIDYALKTKSNDKLIEKSNKAFIELNTLGIKKYVKKSYAKKLFLSKTAFMLKGKKRGK